MPTVEIIPGPLPSYRIHSVHPKRRELMLQTHDQMKNCARLYVKLGYRYIIGWRDVRGFGLSVVQFAEWQTPSSAPYVNLRLS